MIKFVVIAICIITVFFTTLHFANISIPSSIKKNFIIYAIISGFIVGILSIVIIVLKNYHKKLFLETVKQQIQEQLSELLVNLPGFNEALLTYDVGRIVYIFRDERDYTIRNIIFWAGFGLSRNMFCWAILENLGNKKASLSYKSYNVIFLQDIPLKAGKDKIYDSTAALILGKVAFNLTIQKPQKTIVLQLRPEFCKKLLEAASSRQKEKVVGGAGDQLQKLAELAKQGLLSNEEWERAKELFLGKPAEKQKNIYNTLIHLHTLYKKGVLTESEFNMKKWDILSKK
ncbi:MAG: SHOCT domain-containing protein [Candidatus Heimdallarchaeaceae archaeon]